MASTVEQLVAISNINAPSTTRRKQAVRVRINADPASDTTGFDMLLSSHGSLAITLSRKGQLGRFTRRLFTFDELEQLAETQFVTSNMFEFAQKAVEFAALQPPVPEVDTLTETLFTQNELLSKKERFNILHTIIRYADATADISFLEPYLQQHLTSAQRRDAFYILAGVTKPIVVVEAQKLLITYGLQNPLESTKLQAILAVGSSHQVHFVYFFIHTLNPNLKLKLEFSLIDQKILE
jgi:hypothetical protein